MTTLKQEYLGKLKELVKWLDQERPSMNSVFGDILGARLAKINSLESKIKSEEITEADIINEERKDMIIGKLMEGSFCRWRKSHIE